MAGIKVSVIVPVYNGEQFLEQCISSVLGQTLEELEVICVDDGSTDSSAQIIRRMQEKDARILSLRQENQGAGRARNLGIRTAGGKYVAFLDADDFYLDRDALERMYAACEAQKVAVCGSLRKRMEYGSVYPTELFQEADKGAVLRYEDFQLDYDYQNFIFLREHLTEKSLYFPDYRRYQDPPFLVRALYDAQKFTVSDTYLYCYRASDIAPRFDAKKTADLLRGLVDNLGFAKEHGLEMLFKKTVYRLEYEYETVICRSAGEGDADVLGMLAQADQIIRGQYGREDGPIRPLQILDFDMEAYEQELTESIEAADKIVLYGAGSFGRIFLGYLRRRGFGDRVEAFVVSEAGENPLCVGGVPVRQLKPEEQGAIFITASEKAQKEIGEALAVKGYGNYRLVRVEFLDLLHDWG